MTFRHTLTTAALLTTLLALGAQAQAQSLTVKCKATATRSTAEVEGYGLTPGWYSAVLESAGGAHRVQTTLEHADRDRDDGPKDDDVDFEFDSKPSEVRDGDTEIARNFIVDRTVTAILLDASGVEVTRQSATCKRR